MRINVLGKVREEESARQYGKARDPLQNLISPVPSPGLRANVVDYRFIRIAQIQEKGGQNKGVLMEGRKACAHPVIVEP